MNTHNSKTINLSKISVIAGVLSMMTFGFFVSVSSLQALSVNLNTNASVSANSGANASGTTGTIVKLDAKTNTRIVTGKKHANDEIDRRVTALNDLDTQINAMVRVNADEKVRLSNLIKTQISGLVDLKTKISEDTTIDVLKTDIKSITTSYRIFMLVVSQGHITATSDSIMTTVNMMASLGAKLEARIKVLQNSGSDVKTDMVALTDMSIKITDAKVQTDAAFNLIANLTPDNGDKVKMKANDDAFVSARAKLTIARTDLETARKDARKIILDLKNVKVNTKVSATSTTTVQ